jgi:hypothetical protein
LQNWPKKLILFSGAASSSSRSPDLEAPELHGHGQLLSRVCIRVFSVSAWLVVSAIRSIKYKLNVPKKHIMSRSPSRERGQQMQMGQQQQQQDAGAAPRREEDRGGEERMVPKEDQDAKIFVANLTYMVCLHKKM